MGSKTADADILIVEDNPGDANLLMRAFQKGKIKRNILVIQDGESAVNYLLAEGDFANRDRASTPILIVLDISLPKMNGLDVLKIIKENGLTKDIDVVVITGSEDESDMVRSYNLGVKTYIKKSVVTENAIKVITSNGEAKSLEKLLRDAYEELGQ